MHDSPWASVSVSQPTAFPGTVWSDAVLYTTAGDNNNIIQTFPRKIRKYGFLFKEGRTASPVLMQLCRYERFHCRLDTQCIEELQYSSQPLCVPRTAYCVLRQSGPSFLYSLFVTVNITTGFASKQR
jgi:hypothetical protein